MESAHDDLSGLCQRLNHLERAHRRLKRAVTAGLLGLAALGVLGQAVPRSKVVEAERFVLLDSAGKLRAQLSADDSTSLKFYDSALVPQIMLVLGRDDRPFFSVGLSGKGMILLGVKDTPNLSLLDSAGKVRGGFILQPDNSPALVLADAAEKDRATMKVLADGTPFLTLADPKGQAVLGPWYLGFVDEAQRARVALTPLGLGLSDETGRLRAVLGETKLQTSGTGTVEQRPASSLVLFHRDGKVIWKAP